MEIANLSWNEVTSERFNNPLLIEECLVLLYSLTRSGNTLMYTFVELAEKYFHIFFFHRPNPSLDHIRFFFVLGGIQFDQVFDILIIELFTLIHLHLLRFSLFEDGL